MNDLTFLLTGKPYPVPTLPEDDEPTAKVKYIKRTEAMEKRLLETMKGLGPAKVSQIAKAVGITHRTIQKQMRQLEAKGLAVPEAVNSINYWRAA